MSSTIDIEDAVEFVEVQEQVMKAERVISWRFNHVDRAGSTDFGMGGQVSPPHRGGTQGGDNGPMGGIST